MRGKEQSQADLVEVEHTRTTHRTGAVAVPGTLNASQTKNLSFIFSFLSLLYRFYSVFVLFEENYLGGI